MACQIICGLIVNSKINLNYGLAYASCCFFGRCAASASPLSYALAVRSVPAALAAARPRSGQLTRPRPQSGLGEL
jgi:hypothetical protein